MATGKVAVTEGAGVNVAAYTIAEDSGTKVIQRVVINDQTGAEVVPPTTSTKGNPTPNMLTVQQGNDVRKIAAVSATAAGVIGDVIDNSSDGQSFSTLGLEVVAISAGDVVQVQGSVSGTAWKTLRGTNADGDITSGSQSAVGQVNYDVSPYAYLRISHTGTTSVTVQGILRKGAPTPRALTASTNQPVGTTMTGAGNRTFARAANAMPTAVANGTAVDLLATLLGALVTKPFALPENDWSYAAAQGGIVDTGTVPLALAAGSGLRNYLTSVDIQNAHASVDTEVQILDGTNVIWRCLMKAGTTRALHFNSPLKSLSNSPLQVKCVTTGATVYVNAQGYQAP